MSDWNALHYSGQARYVPVHGAWSPFGLEFDPPLMIPSGYAARYTTPLPPDTPPNMPGPWFPVTATFEPDRSTG